MRAAQGVAQRPTLCAAALSLFALACNEARPAIVREHPRVVEPVAAIERAPSGFALDSEPSGARVWVDGREVGQTPTRVTNLSPGDHSIRLRADSYLPWESSVHVSTGVIDLPPARLELENSVEPPAPPMTARERERARKLDRLRGPHRVRFEEIVPRRPGDQARWTRALRRYRHDLLQCYRALPVVSQSELDFPAGEVRVGLISMPDGSVRVAMLRSRQDLAQCVKAAFQQPPALPPRAYGMNVQFKVVFERAHARVPPARARAECGNDAFELPRPGVDL